MKNNDPRRGDDLLAVVVLLLLFGAGVWYARSEIWSWFLQKIDPYLGLIVTIGGVIVGAVVTWFIAPLVLELIFYFKRLRQMETKRIILSRDDTTEPFEIMKFLDSCNGMLMTKFPIYGHFIGFDHLVWEQGVEDGRKYIEVSAPQAILDEICGSFQSVYQNVRFETVPAVKKKELPAEYLQVRLERHWFYSLQTLRNYQKVMSESIFASVENVEGDGRRSSSDGSGWSRKAKEDEEDTRKV